MKVLIAPDKPGCAGIGHGLGVFEALHGARRAAKDAVQHRPGRVLRAFADLVAGGAFLEDLRARLDQLRVGTGRVGFGCGVGCRLCGRCRRLHGRVGVGQGARRAAVGIGWRHVQGDRAFGDLHLGGAVGHAGFAREGRIFAFSPVVGIKAVRVRHRDAGEVLLRQHEVILNDPVGIEQEGGDCVGLIRSHGLGRAKGHGAVDIIPHGRQVRPVGADGLDRAAILQRSFAPGENGPVVDALGEVAVAGGAFLGKDLIPGEDVARPFGQAGAVGQDRHVPGGDFLGQRGAA